MRGIVKTLFILTILGLIGYTLFLLSVPYYHYLAFKSDLKEILRVSVTDKPGEVMEKIMNIVEQYNIPVNRREIKLTNKNGYRVQVSWTEEVNFYNLYERKFAFSIDTGAE
jgi:hypothetical protein